MTSYRVTNLSGTTGAAFNGNARMTALDGFALYAEHTNPVRVSTLDGFALTADKTNAVRATMLTVYSFQSLDETSSPTRLNSGHFGIINAIADPDPVIKPDLTHVEPNPYKPTTPASVSTLDDDLSHHFDEQQQTLRKQHNITQAGDSTFPWDQLTESTTERAYTLGSLGRFFHESYGLLMARYVQFSQVLDSRWTASPFGRLKTSSKVDWIVTNDFDKSGADLVLGVGMLYTTPNEGEYGWLVVSGANLVTLQNADHSIPTQNDYYVWNESFKLTRNGQGKVVARSWGALSTAALDPGLLFCEVEGPSLAEIKAKLGDDLAAIQNEVAALTQVVNSLSSSVDAQDYGPEIQDLQAKITSLQSAVTLEGRTRSDQIIALTQQIGAAATLDQLNNYKTQNNAAIKALGANLQTQITALNRSIAKLSAAAGKFDGPGLTTRVTALEALTKVLSDRIIGATNTNYFGFGLEADRPAILTIVAPALGMYYASDTGAMYIWDDVGLSWLTLSAGGGGAGAGSRAACSVSSTQVILAQQNVSAVTKLHVGCYRITFTTAFADTNYVVAGTGKYDSSTSNDAPLIGINQNAAFGSPTGKQLGYVDIILTDSTGGGLYDGAFDVIIFAATGVTGGSGSGSDPGDYDPGDMVEYFDEASA